MIITKSAPITDRHGASLARVQVWNDNVGEWFTFDIPVTRFQHFSDAAEKWFDGNAAFWANLTAADVDRIERRTTQMFDEFSKWGTD